MYVGYARVSTSDQNLHMQLDALTNAGCIKIFEEKVSGKSRQRPELEAMLEMLREGDTVVIYKLDRLGRSIRHLIELSDYFSANNINLISLHENIDTSTPTGRLLFNFFAMLSEFEREMIVERTKSGIEAARARGRYGGRPRKDAKAVQKALKLYASKQYSMAEIVEMTNVSESTIRRRAKEKEEKA